MEKNKDTTNQRRQKLSYELLKTKRGSGNAQFD